MFSAWTFLLILMTLDPQVVDSRKLQTQCVQKKRYVVQVELPEVEGVDVTDGQPEPNGAEIEVFL